MQIVGLDLGRHNVKLFNGQKYISFPSIVGEARELRLNNDYGKKAYRVEFDGEKFFAGTLAQNESEFARQMLVEDKATDDALLLALIALHQADHDEFEVITGLPVDIHTDNNKQSLIKLLEGTHTIVVNDIKKRLTIKSVRVAVEGGAGFWSLPKNGLVRILDGGSKTINYITLNDKRYIDRDSGTLKFGFDTNKSTNKNQLAHRIAGELGRKWNSNDAVYVVGGEAEFLVAALKPYFPNIQLLHSNKQVIDRELIDLNLYANAVGYFNIGNTLKVRS